MNKRSKQPSGPFKGVFVCRNSSIPVHLRSDVITKQGRIHGNPVADGWAGAVIQRPIASLEIFVTDGRTDGPTDTVRCRVACPRLKREWNVLEIKYLVIHENGVEFDCTMSKK